MGEDNKVNVLLVDDQPSKLLSYEVMLEALGENLIKASSAREALELLLKNDIAVVLVDVCMPELDGFELAAMIREHPRFQKTAIIFISAIHISEMDYLRGYSAGAVDYVPVPVVPEVLRAKVKIFAELYRKTRQLEELNRDLEHRISERTAALEGFAARLLRSERGRSLALAAGNMGSWEYDVPEDRWSWDEGHCRIFGLDPQSFNSQVFVPTGDLIRSFFPEADWSELRKAIDGLTRTHSTLHKEIRIIRADGHMRWCVVSAAGSFDSNENLTRVDGVTIDITERKEAEERQMLLAREVDHRARNALAIVQAIVRLARAESTPEFVRAVEGRIRALAQTHELLSQARWQGADILRLINDELAPYRIREGARISINGPPVILPPDKAQIIALSIHELATNAAKYGALSANSGEITVEWEMRSGQLKLRWTEANGPRIAAPARQGFGMKIITASVSQQNGGQADFEWRPEGLSCTLALRCRGPEPANDLPSASRESLRLVERNNKGPHILVVEDEALVGMLISDLLEDLGCTVSGPISNLNEAMEAAKQFDFDAALLDVNLGGSCAFPVAEILQTRRVPFIFLTGYASDGLDPQFSGVPTLQKPFEKEALERVLLTALADAAQQASKRAIQ